LAPHVQAALQPSPPAIVQSKAGNAPVVQPFWEKTDKAIIWNPAPLDEDKYTPTGKYHGGLCGFFQSPVYRRVKKPETKELTWKEIIRINEQTAKKRLKEERRELLEYKQKEKELNEKLELERVEKEKKEQEFKLEWERSHTKVEVAGITGMIDDLDKKSEELRKSYQRDPRILGIHNVANRLKKLIGKSKEEVEVEIHVFKELRDEYQILLKEKPKESPKIIDISSDVEEEAEVVFDKDNPDTWTLKPIKFLNGVSRGDIEQYTGGAGILNRLASGALNGNGPTGRVWAKTDAPMHDHLNNGTGGIAFIYKHDGEGNVTPTVYDFAASRWQGNGYKWEIGGNSAGNSTASFD
jgi:hypothetical protein